MKNMNNRRKFLKDIVIGAASATVLSRCGKLSDPSDKKTHRINPPLPTNDFHKGIQLTSWWYDDYLKSEVDNTLSKFKDLGVDSVSVLCTQYQDTEKSTVIYPLSNKTPLDAGVRNVLNKIKNMGMRTILKPHVDPLSGWRGNISFDNEADWQAWFTSYRTFINHYAKIAEDIGADLFVEGVELGGTLGREADWNQTDEGVLYNYGGKRTFAFNWDDPLDIPLIDRLDYIGINSYFPLTNKLNPTQDELNQAWINLTNNLKNISELKQKPIMITELGYQDRNGTNITPWYCSGSKDENEQAQCYEAALNSLLNKDFIKGLFWWDVHWNRADLDGFTPLGKLAEAVINDYYHREA